MIHLIVNAPLLLRGEIYLFGCIINQENRCDKVYA
nr:MAG TPA: hypothetical protein [Caudoviricetes sp.]DAT87494.1 MAG TPA: hypothetical protein [Caudoviricetes sp.]